jgi:hypothetical protein
MIIEQLEIRRPPAQTGFVILNQFESSVPLVRAEGGGWMDLCHWLSAAEFFATVDLAQAEIGPYWPAAQIAFWDGHTLSSIKSPDSLTSHPAHTPQIPHPAPAQST